MNNLHRRSLPQFLMTRGLKSKKKRRVPSSVISRVEAGG